MMRPGRVCAAAELGGDRRGRRRGQQPCRRAEDRAARARRTKEGERASCPSVTVILASGAPLGRPQALPWLTPRGALGR
eukprot:scaffold142_cov315-Prasinococcus_capsulatus_cf.AAC.8